MNPNELQYMDRPRILSAKLLIIFLPYNYHLQINQMVDAPAAKLQQVISNICRKRVSSSTSCQSSFIGSFHPSSLDIPWLECYKVSYLEIQNPTRHQQKVLIIGIYRYVWKIFHQILRYPSYIPYNISIIISKIFPFHLIFCHCI